ncbi:MAG: glycine C-acetyltransferase [Pseudomonadota bacterium]
MGIDRLAADLSARTDALRTEGLFKPERVISTPQGAQVDVDGRRAINLCANNYLGLAGHPDLARAAARALDGAGYGMASVRFICGTQALHKTLETRLAAFIGAEDAILYSSCFDANAGLFETLLDEEDAILSDALNHASIIDGVRLCKARRLRYDHNDMAALEARLKDAMNARTRMIVTDGVFSMDGTVANLPAICDLADAHDAIVVVDDSHAVGFWGDTGRGTPEAAGVAHRVPITTGTLGKALGGASGGYVTGPAAVIEWLRQRSRPYLFSNALAPMIAAASLTALDMVEAGAALRAQLHRNTAHFRAAMAGAGFEILPGAHPIVPVMLRDPQIATAMAARLNEEGIFVAAFSYPVVPKGQDRIRTQMSAAHTIADLDRAIDAFARMGRETGALS